MSNTSLVYSLTPPYYAAWSGVRPGVFIRRVASRRHSIKPSRERNSDFPVLEGCLNRPDATAAAAAVVSRACV